MIEDRTEARDKVSSAAIRTIQQALLQQLTYQKIA